MEKLVIVLALLPFLVLLGFVLDAALRFFSEINRHEKDLHSHRH
mgnify:CR=1 FL=1